ncbi:MAG: hypothetical protein Kow0069_19720 [Promethearchaeota archaeon]
MLIPRGTVWWHARPEDIFLINRQQYHALRCSHLAESELSAAFLRAIDVYSYYVQKVDALVFCLDDSRFVNHSFEPNSGGRDAGMLDPFRSVALRDIQPGEEILEDYTEYDECPWSPDEGFCAELRREKSANARATKIVERPAKLGLTSAKN